MLMYLCILNRLHCCALIQPTLPYQFYSIIHLRFRRHTHTDALARWLLPFCLLLDIMRCTWKVDVCTYEFDSSLVRINGGFYLSKHGWSPNTSPFLYSVKLQNHVNVSKCMYNIKHICLCVKLLFQQIWYTSLSLSLYLFTHSREPLCLCPNYRNLFRLCYRHIYLTQQFCVYNNFHFT